MTDMNGNKTEAADNELINTAIIWAVVSIAFGIIAVTFNNSPMVLGASIWAKIAAAIVGSIIGLIGAMIGDAIRRFATPDMYFTTGGVGQLIWMKIFWKIGFQSIGMFIGVFLGVALVLG